MKRIEELDFARAVAMLSVIMIHVTSTYVGFQSKFMLFNMNLAFVLNQVTRFAVPLFILLSGTSLALSEPEADLKSFYKRRFTKIGIPYIFWCAAYFLYNNHSNLSALRIDSFIKGILLGQEAPHLYFIVIILQLYLLYPFLIKMVTKSPWLSIFISFLISYTIQKLVFFCMLDAALLPMLTHLHFWLLFPTWLFYFVVGMALTKQRLSQVQMFASKNAPPILIGTVFFSILYIAEGHVTGSLDSIKSSLNLFTLLILLSSFSLWKFIGKYHVVQRASRFLAKHSLTIYFEHVLVLYFLRRFSIFAHGMLGMLLLYMAVVAGAIPLAVLVDQHTKTSNKRIPVR